MPSNSSFGPSQNSIWFQTPLIARLSPLVSRASLRDSIGLADSHSIASIRVDRFRDQYPSTSNKSSTVSIVRIPLPGTLCCSRFRPQSLSHTNQLTEPN